MRRRRDIHWITEAGMFFEKQGPVWDTLRDLVARLEDAGIDYVVIGGLALNAHRYPRQTSDVDVVLTVDGLQRFRQEIVPSAYAKTEGLPRRFVDRRSETSVDVLVSGELAGRTSKNQTIRFPDPSEGVLCEDLRTVSLARLIELKLVTWRFKDWGDVVELIRRNSLSAAFLERLDPLVRSAFGECWNQANDATYEGPSGV